MVTPVFKNSGSQVMAQILKLGWRHVQVGPLGLVFFEKKEPLQVLLLSLLNKAQDLLQASPSRRIIEQAFFGLGKQPPRLNVPWVFFGILLQARPRPKQVRYRSRRWISPHVGALHGSALTFDQCALQF